MFVIYQNDPHILWLGFKYFIYFSKCTTAQNFGKSKGKLVQGKGAEKKYLSEFTEILYEFIKHIYCNE